VPAERHGALVIIVLGESVADIGIVYFLGGGEPLGEQCVVELVKIGEVERSDGRERYRHVGIRRHVGKTLLGEEPGSFLP